MQAVCDFVHQHIKFDYQQARSTRTAFEAFNERIGVCRDYAHLALTLCRCLNIPARYVNGHLGDNGVSPGSESDARALQAEVNQIPNRQGRPSTPARLSRWRHP